MSDVYLLPAGGSVPLRKTTNELRRWKTSLEDKQHELRRKQRRGDKDPKIPELLEEIALNREIAYIDLKLEDLPTTADDALRKDLEGDRKYVTLQLDLFNKEKASKTDPSDQLKREIEAVKHEIQDLSRDGERPYRP